MVVAVVVDMAVATFETGIATPETEIEIATFETPAMALHFGGIWTATGVAETEILILETIAVALAAAARDRPHATSAT